MPNYSYRCKDCNSVEIVTLPISSDPSAELECSTCKGSLVRKVGLIAPTAFKGFKVFAGDWFKKTYGHEIGEDGETAAEAKRDFEKFANEVKKETGDIF